jgi:hypothetical protein
VRGLDCVDVGRVRGLRFFRKGADSGPKSTVSTFPGVELVRGKLLAA